MKRALLFCLGSVGAVAMSVAACGGSTVDAEDDAGNGSSGTISSSGASGDNTSGGSSSGDVGGSSSGDMGSSSGGSSSGDMGSSSGGSSSGGSSSGGGGGVPIGGVCGGIAGLLCEEGAYCKFKPAAKCGASDETGRCTAIPAECGPDIGLNGVCGCDNTWYPSECAAAQAGTGVLNSGNCIGGAGATCGGRTHHTCERGFYCNYDAAAQCGRADAPGKCKERPGDNDLCLAVIDPVRGCDGQCYSNSCYAAKAGVSVDPAGAACPGGPVIQ